ncbi:YciI family protein [Shewanella zhangzhouensis]|nr:MULTISPECIES: YciI family protein [Shewanella]QYJ77278.1 YciI family protein [Shewanella sp. FJAT-52076]QYK07207.1 YciI family protein [Shewanella zhangzhouensis]
MFIVSLTYLVELAEVEKHLQAHLEYLDKHYALGHFLASGPKSPRTGGVILSHLDSREQLDAILNEDPFFRYGIANMEITRFMPSKAAPGFEALLSL